MEVDKIEKRANKRFELQVKRLTADEQSLNCTAIFKPDELETDLYSSNSTFKLSSVPQ